MTAPPLVRSLFRIVIGVFLALVAVLGVLACCQRKIIYYPRPYGKTEVDEFKGRHHGQRLEFETGEGKQVAFMHRTVRQEGPPKRLWLVCGGNGARALDYSDVFAEFGESGDDFLYIDYPGYGECEGKASPDAIKDSVVGAVDAAAKSLKMTREELKPRLRFVGHSLGAAAVLIGAENLDIRRGVLLSPFTSTMDMASHMLRLPVGWIVWHRFDNVERLRTLLARGSDAEVWILHGANDEVIPVKMSHTLAALDPKRIHFREEPNVTHNDICDLCSKEIFAAMREARK